MKLTPNLEDFSSLIIDDKKEKGINNIVVHLRYSKENLIIEIDSMKNQNLSQLRTLVSQFEEKQDYMGVGVSTYEVKDLNALRKELTKIKAL